MTLAESLMSLRSDFLKICYLNVPERNTKIKCFYFKTLTAQTLPRSRYTDSHLPQCKLDIM